MIKYAAKIDALSNFEKIGRALFHQINLMKRSQTKLKSLRVKKKLQK